MTTETTDFRWQVAARFEACQRKCQRLQQAVADWDHCLRDCDCCHGLGYAPAPDPEMGWLLALHVLEQTGFLAIVEDRNHGGMHAETGFAGKGDGTEALEALANAALSLPEGEAT